MREALFCPACGNREFFNANVRVTEDGYEAQSIDAEIHDIPETLKDLRLLCP